MDDVNQLLDNIGAEAMVKGSETILPNSPVESLPLPSELEFSWLLKGPSIIILLANIFFAVLLFLRARILADTVATAQSKQVKSIIVIYLAVTVIGTLLSILFLILA